MSRKIKVKYEWTIWAHYEGYKEIDVDEHPELLEKIKDNFESIEDLQTDMDTWDYVCEDFCEIEGEHLVSDEWCKGGVNQMPFKIELTNIEFDELLHPEEDEEDE